MKGIFQTKSPLPKYSSSWDVSKAFAHIKSVGDNNSLSLKQLSRKFALLLTLTSAERGSALVAHDLRFMKYHPEGVEFNLSKFNKSFRVGTSLRYPSMPAFPRISFFVLVNVLRPMKRARLPSDPWTLDNLPNFS